MNYGPERELPFVSIHFSAHPTAAPEISENLEIFHVLQGSICLHSGNEEHHLAEDDIILVNAGTVFEIELPQEALYGQTSITFQQLLTLLGRGEAEFLNGSEQRGTAAYSRLEASLWKLYEIKTGQGENTQIQFLSASYQLVEILAGAFLQVAQEDPSAQTQKEARDEQILRFIRSHYPESVTLDELAGELYLSNAYLSKYIKKRFQMNFLQLLNTVRLSHASRQLKESGESITRIALANGFSSVASFNRLFQEAYSMAPSDYRKTSRSGPATAGENPGGEETVPPQLREQIGERIRHFHEREKTAVLPVQLETSIDALNCTSSRLRRNWQKVINVGTAYDLTRSDYQQQLLLLKEKLGFEYVRFWDVFSQELRINIHDSPQNANFGAIFRIIDFLIDHNMRPFFELAFKPIRISRNTNDAIIDQHRRDVFSSPEELHDFIIEFARQLTGRYGNREVSSWYFEYWKIDPLMFYVDARKQKNFSVPNEKYFEEFDALTSGLREVLPFAKVGGGGFTFRTYGEKGMAEIFDRWKLRKCQPDFISLNCFRYRNTYNSDGEMVQERYDDPAYIKKLIEDTTRIMRERGFRERKVFITEFNFTVSNRSVENDSCSKAAALLQTLLLTDEQTEVLAYWTAMDAYAEYSDTRSVLFGGVGLLSKDGIPKPAFFTFDFLRRLDDDVVEKTPDYIITRQGSDSYKILCQNYRGYTDDYFERRENEIGLREFASYSADEREKHLRIRLTNVPNGRYQIRIREVDRRNGSIMGVWQRLGFDPNLNRDDVAFMRQICVPGMRRMEIDVIRGELEFELRLSPNSIKYAHLVRQSG